MARINIEDSLFLDERFCFVSLKIGRFEAVGQFLYISKLAQRYWKEDRSLIPFQIFEMGEFSDYFIKSGLVEKRENGVYLKGSEDNFAWLLSRVNNGKRGGRPCKNNYIEKPTHNPQEPTHNPLTLTLTPALTLTPTKETKKREREGQHELIESMSSLDKEFHQIAMRLTPEQQEKLILAYGYEVVYSYVKQVGAWKKYSGVRSLYMTMSKWISNAGIENRTERLLAQKTFWERENGENKNVKA